jgi:glycosyltransferase involved in cell wall biosynthesis
VNSTVVASIYIPVYNGERFLRQTLDACLAQTLPNIEIIVANDGSHDGSLALMREYAAQHANIRVVDNPQNIGLAKTWNHCVSLAHGTYVMYLSQDDIVPPHHLETIVRQFDADTAFVFCNSVYIDESGREGKPVYEESHQHRNMRHCARAIALHNFVNPCGIVFRRNLFIKVGGWDERFRNYGEWLLWTKLLAVGKPHFTTDTQSSYRRHSTNLTNTFDDPKVRRGLQEYFNFCRDYAIDHGGFRAPMALVLSAFMQASRLNHGFWQFRKQLSGRLRKIHL